MAGPLGSSTSTEIAFSSLRCLPSGFRTRFIRRTGRLARDRDECVPYRHYGFTSRRPIFREPVDEKVCVALEPPALCFGERSKFGLGAREDFIDVASA